MSGFPILFVFPALRQRIVTKVSTEAYFRLQQTSHEVNDFIRSCPNISIPVGGSYYLTFDNNTSSFDVLTMDIVVGKIDTLYGTRLNSLCIYGSRPVEEVCTALTANRITCRALDMKTMNRDWTKDECLALLSALKPVEVEIDCGNGDSYEALSQVKIIKNLEVDMNPQDLPSAILPILSTMSKVTLSLPPSGSIPYDKFTDTLKILTENEFPQLDEFTLCLMFRENTPSPDEFMRRFHSYPVTLRDLQMGNVLWAEVAFPEDRNVSCRIFIEDGRAGILFRRRGKAYQGVPVPPLPIVVPPPYDEEI